MQQTQTATQQLASHLLGQDVIEWAIELRTRSPKWSCQLIADEIAKRTDGAVKVTGEAVRRWVA